VRCPRSGTSSWGCVGTLTLLPAHYPPRRSNTLPQWVQVELPEGAQRVAVTATAEESEEVLLSLKGSPAVMLLLDVKPNLRVQASRRVFEVLKSNDINVR
jgi:hypothetical protein